MITVTGGVDLYRDLASVRPAAFRRPRRAFRPDSLLGAAEPREAIARAPRKAREPASRRTGRQSAGSHHPSFYGEGPASVPADADFA